MQTRVAFNSGEFSPEMECRSDLEQYGRGCSVLENWQVSQMGGIKRRRGMRYVADALSDSSRLIPYIYSYSDAENARFLVEVDFTVVRVLSLEGKEVARFESSSDPGKVLFGFTPDAFRYYQQNKLLFITSAENPPMVLEYDGQDTWSFKEWAFKHRPWRYNEEIRDHAIEVKKMEDDIEVVFPDGVPEDETAEVLDSTERLRVSFWLEQAEEKSIMREVLRISDIQQTNGSTVKKPLVQIVSNVPANAFKGDMFAVNQEELIKYWVCTADWATSNYVDGLESPANYSGAFAPAEDIEGFESLKPIYSVKELKDKDKVAKGTKIAVRSGYWEYYTCIKDFTKPDDNYTSFADYPSFFVRGLPVGDAVPCRGKWSFYCSGVWFGSYEVRRNYDSSELSDNWEDRGLSFSRNDAASNTSISGTEADEECYLRLFLTRSRCLNPEDLTSGFPPDGCANRLIVEGFKHDMVLTAQPVGDSGDVLWTCDDVVQFNWGGMRSIKDWSWEAFSSRSGYPLHCCVFQQRLVFAGTIAQPLTTWFSRVDDIDNFLRGDADDAAMTLTLSSPSQNPICWLQAQDDRLMLGTSCIEYTIASSSSNLVFSGTSARARAHSHVGSDGTPAIAVINKAVFVERGAGRVYEYGWNEESAGFIPRELSIFAPHIGEGHGGFIYPTLMTKPDVVLVWTMGDGQLALCTYNSMQEVKAWHRWITDGKILSACAMPDGKNQDKLYLIVKRQDKASNGTVMVEYVNIEVVDKESPYVDHGGRDYTSTVITNALFAAVQERVSKRNDNGFYIRFGSAFEYEPGSLEITVAGDAEWLNPDWNNGTVQGWKEVRCWSTWRFEKQAGIRVHGERDCHILGLQG
ncbi:MAG: hypothetical protein IKZ07_05520 [Akkermansia sp.]|nr:hypothetical protein [Akkermansia sp.]